jgi:exosortase
MLSALNLQVMVLGLFVAAAYFPTFVWLWERWTVADTYYSHGPLIPVICLGLIFLKRKTLDGLRPSPYSAGWILFGAGIAIHLISSLWQVYFSSGFSLLLVIPGLILIFLGKEYLKVLSFPICFLAFMLPLPLVIIANVSFKVKIIAAESAITLVRLAGVAAAREGSVIRTANAVLQVEDPCSGIRSLIALIALGSLMAYFSKLSLWKKIVLFVSSVPIAIAANVVRIAVVTVVSEVYGTGFAAGKFHDSMGFFVFVFAFLGLVVVSKLLEKKWISEIF